MAKGRKMEILHITALTVTLIVTVSYGAVLVASIWNNEDYLAKWSNDIF